jgi:hypothetical protein
LYEKRTKIQTRISIFLLVLEVLTVQNDKNLLNFSFMKKILILQKTKKFRQILLCEENFNCTESADKFRPKFFFIQKILTAQKMPKKSGKFYFVRKILTVQKIPTNQQIPAKTSFTRQILTAQKNAGKFS